MSLPSLLQALSLIPQPALSSLPPPNFVPHFLIFAWLFAYALTSTRLIKRYYGMDHNCSPREDVSKYGEIMVKDEKITRDPLDMVKRWEGCHANCVEGFPVLVAGVLLALHASVPIATLNGLMAFYTLARTGYAVSYISIKSEGYSVVRTVFWYAANISCLTMVVLAGKRM